MSTQPVGIAAKRGRPELPKHERVSLRHPLKWSPEQWEQVRKAADLLDIAPSIFVKRAAVRSAKRVLRREGKG